MYKTWNTLRAWFRDSEVILLARLSVIYGFVLAALQGLDWTSLMSMDFSNGFDKEGLTKASFWVIQGIVVELARRSRAQDL